MADVSLDDYILKKNVNTGMNRGFNGPVLGKVVINNQGVRGRLRGGRVKITGPGRGQGRGQAQSKGQMFGTGRGQSQGRGQPQGRGHSFNRGRGQQFGQGRGQQFGQGRGRQFGAGRGVSHGRGQPFGPDTGRPFHKQTITFGNNNGQQPQVGLTTKKFGGGLVTKKNIQPAQGQPSTSVTVTGVGNYQTFDARQKLAIKQDARAKLMEKTKFSDARDRIQNSRTKKQTQEVGIKLTNSKSNPVTFGTIRSTGDNGYGSADHKYGGSNAAHMYGGSSAAHMYGGSSAAHMYGGASAAHMYGGSSAAHMYGGSTAAHMYGSSGDAGVQLSTGGGLTITKPSNVTSASNMFKPLPARHVPPGYEDLFEDEPMSLGSECNTTMDFERGPVIKVKNEHFTKPKPTPITFNSDPKPVSQFTRNAGNVEFSNRPTLRMTASQTISQRQPERQPLRMTTSQPMAPRRQTEPPVNLSRKFSARSAIEEEEEMILNAPTPVLPKSRPAPSPPPEPVKVNTFIGGPPLVLSRSRPKTSQTGPGISGIVLPPSLKASRPAAHAQSAGSATVREKLTLSSRSPAFSNRLGEESTANPGEIRRPPSPTGSQVLVTNLHSIVTQDDIIELFGAIGLLMKVKLIKPGTAEVVYVKRDTALSAVKKYHNRELDGQPMQVKVVTTEATTASKVAADIKALSKSARESKGPPVEPALIHKALFKTSGGSAAPTNPVSFTVQI